MILYPSLLFSKFNPIPVSKILLLPASPLPRHFTKAPLLCPIECPKSMVQEAIQDGAPPMFI